MITRRTTLAMLASVLLPAGARANYSEAQYLQKFVDTGVLPDIEHRLPKNPRLVNVGAMGREAGTHGGTVRMLIGGQRDIRLMPINSYSRLVGFNEKLDLVADILESFTVDEDRIFTLHLREGHRWSDGAPFTSEDFRYCWEDDIQNRELHKGGPPVDLLVDGKEPVFEVLDELTIRYSWEHPMPDFLNKLAAPVPLRIVLPSAYLRQFHVKYQDPAVLAAAIKKNRVDDWSSLHMKMSRQNRPENPDLPTLEPWRPTTAPPAEQFVFERNPYFHRVDENGRQLPYVDRMVLNVSSSDIIAAKTATGESDLQFVSLDFSDYTLLKEAEKIHPIKVSLWKRTQGSRIALLPNLNHKDAVWRAFFQDVRVRRALSLAIDRNEINKAVFYGLGQESADTLLPESPLFKPEYAAAWSWHDPAEANALLDSYGMTKRDDDGIRLLPDGRSAHIIIETAGESTLETDVLELVTDHFLKIGISLFIRTSQRDIFRSRAIGGEVMMSVWQGLDNGIPTADMAPTQLAPTADDQLQWPVWGMYYLSAQTKGQPPDMPEAKRLVELLNDWHMTTTTEERAAIWQEMLAIHAQQVFSIGTVNGALQPMVRSARLKNVPEKALFGFDPTCYLGAYMPDTFWYEKDV